MSILPQEAQWLNLEYLFNRLFVWLKQFFILIKKLTLSLTDVPFKIYFFIAALVFLAVIGVIFYKFARLKRKIKISSLINFKDEEKLSQSRFIKWEEIKNKIDSDNAEDRKEAIVMADSILDEIFSRMGFKGDGLGEKIKNVEPSDFESLQNVWDAYKVRARIAREGARFDISQKEAKDTLAKYEKGLKELKYL